MKEVQQKPTLVIAGPGAGKTWQMVDHVARAIPNLKTNRVLAVITYTNAASDSIRHRLAKKVHIPPNIFIGTIHSFFNKFILTPYANLFEYTSEELVFIETNIDKMVKDYRGNNKYLVRAGIIKKLNKAGKISYPEILRLSAKLIEENRHLSEVICNRLQYLFIDEFQDANNYQFRVIDVIRKRKKTKIYAVGDPEQYIFGFDSRTANFGSIPFNKFRTNSEIIKADREENKRASSEIVKFTNYFHSEIKQVSAKGSIPNSAVYFILDTELDKIVNKYREITGYIETNGKKTTRFYLGYENKTFETCARKYGLTPISNSTSGPQSILYESLNLISSVVGINKRQLCEKYEFDPIQYRKLGVKILKAIYQNVVYDDETLRKFILKSLHLKIENQNPTKIADQINKFKNFFCQPTARSLLEQYSSIHKAKGLEADAVLAIAEKQRYLAKWLTHTKEARYADKTDQCRIGFVAFTRAKNILCFACKEDIDTNLKDTLSKLKVEII